MQSALSIDCSQWEVGKVRTDHATLQMRVGAVFLLRVGPGVNSQKQAGLLAFRAARQ